MPKDTAQKAGRREWWGLAVLALPILVVSMDLNVLHLAVPSLSSDLEPSSAELLWITDIYGFLIAGLLITMGTLGDRIGRRKLLLVGAAAFGAASVLAAFSPNAGILIGTRALLGVAGATLLPSTLSLIRTMFHDDGQRKIAIAVWITSFSLGGALGPLIGGALLNEFWWGSVFLPGVPVMALLLALGPVLLPEYRNADVDRLDLVSVVLSLLAALSVVYGLKQIAENGFGWVSAASVVVGVVLGVAFVRRQRSLREPLLDIRLFGNTVFSVSLAAQTLAVFVMAGGQFFIAQYLQLVLGLSPLQAGLLTLPTAASLIVGSMLAPLLVRWTQPAYVMGGGLLVATVGFGLLTQIDGGSSPAVVASGFAVVALGLSPVVALSTDLLVGAAPPQRAGAASAISETGNEFGGALGIALLGSAGIVVYRAQMPASLPPEIPDAAASAALDTLGGAVSAASSLAEPMRAEVLTAGRAAFVDGLRLVVSLGGLIALSLALLTVVTLRRTASSHSAEIEDDSAEEQVSQDSPTTRNEKMT